MPGKYIADYAVHPQSGSNVPGKVDANPFMNMHPNELREKIKIEQDPDIKAQMVSALKQFERQYNGLGYPWRITRAMRILAYKMLKMAEVVNPAINLPYYQDLETDQGQEEIIDSLEGLYDNDNAEKFDYARQGIRPIRDIDTAEGDFLNPKESPIGGPVTRGEGDGPDPEGLEYPDPPTGGDIDGI